MIRKSAPRRFDDVGAGPRSTPNCSNGACSDATYIASGAQAKASREETVAHRAEVVSGREAAVLGVNVNCDPCVDILMSWRNTIVNTRAYDTAADDVIRDASAYLHGLRRRPIRSPASSTSPATGWRSATAPRPRRQRPHPRRMGAIFGRLYRHHIDRGLEMIMAGHIALPQHCEPLDPSRQDEDAMPATLAPELVQGLLKGQLGFNGVVVTTSTTCWA